MVSLTNVLFCCSLTLLAQDTNKAASQANGVDAHWATAAKNGFGTANTIASRVWFTLADGMMTEVYYPTLDVPNVQCLQLVVVSQDGRTVDTEERDTTHSLEVVDRRALTFRQVNRSRRGDYAITKTYTVDPKRPTVLIHVEFESAPSRSYVVYVYYDPSLNNSGRHDSAWTEGKALLAADADKASALLARGEFEQMTNDYAGVGDGLEQLRAHGHLTETHSRVTDGNVVQLARVPADKPFTLALGFGKETSEALRNATASLSDGFAHIQRSYQAGWHAFVAHLPRVERKYQRQFVMSAMVLRALEDKTYRGAIIASPSIPWGGGPNANEPTISGYHAVWARDLYQVATALQAIGDRASAQRALDYLFKFQQRSDGSFPQNTRVDGQAIGGGLQLDQVALPIVLAYQLQPIDRRTWLDHVKPAADFIVSHGPATGQDRWEEKPGYSPATIAAEIAGLVCAAEIARRHNDRLAARSFLKTADQWAGSVDRWTATTNGPYGSGHYYLRITENGDADDGAKIEINSGGGNYEEREIVDAGFLELVRLGIKSPADPLITKSLSVVDKQIKIQTPRGSAWYRYNHDAYGERRDGGAYDGRTGVGRLWTLLTGERGEYELARGRRSNARKLLQTMMSFANEGLMIPEQVWDQAPVPLSNFQVGAGTGSATPLGWSMAQFVRLAVNIEHGRNLETPQIVAVRYRKGSKEK